MAKLKRETRTETVKPIGIVQMSGMRDVAKGLMETSRTAQEFQQFFTSYGAEKTKEISRRRCVFYAEPETTPCFAG